MKSAELNYRLRRLRARIDEPVPEPSAEMKELVAEINRMVDKSKRMEAAWFMRPAILTTVRTALARRGLLVALKRALRKRRREA